MLAACSRNVSENFLVPNPVPGLERVTIHEYRLAARDRVVGVTIPAGGKRFIHFLRAVSRATHPRRNILNSSWFMASDAALCCSRQTASNRRPPLVARTISRHAICGRDQPVLLKLVQRLFWAFHRDRNSRHLRLLPAYLTVSPQQNRHISAIRSRDNS